MALLEAAKENEPVEKPMITVDSITIDGKLRIISNQPMVYPADIQEFDYNNLLAFKMISAKSGRIFKAEHSKRRVLTESDPCGGKLYAQMTSTEKMQYFYSIGYNGYDYLADCQIEKKKNPKFQMERAQSS